MIAETTDLKGVSQGKLGIRMGDQKWKPSTEREKSLQRRQEKQMPRRVVLGEGREVQEGNDQFHQTFLPRGAVILIL